MKVAGRWLTLFCLLVWAASAAAELPPAPDASGLPAAAPPIGKLRRDAQGRLFLVESPAARASRAIELAGLPRPRIEILRLPPPGLEDMAEEAAEDDGWRALGRAAPSI